MIRVDVEEYCHQCLDFHPDVIPPTKMTWSMESEGRTIGDTVIKCEYRKRCAGIKRYLENQAKNEVKE